MIRNERRSMQNELKKIQKGVAVDWLSDMMAAGAGVSAAIARDDLPGALKLAIQNHAPIDLVAKVYAAAIVRHGLSGAVNWTDVGTSIKSVYWFRPDPVAKVKSLAWEEIAKAKVRRMRSAQIHASITPAGKRRLFVWAFKAAIVMIGVKVAVGFLVVACLSLSFGLGWSIGTVILKVIQ